MRFSLFAASIACVMAVSAEWTWTIEKAENPTAEQSEAYDLIEKAVKAATARYARFTDASKALTLSFYPNIPTADGNYNGQIRYGSTPYMNEFTTMHEISHTLGIGQTANFETNCAENNWPTANALLESWDGEGTRVVCDNGHITPYGMNYQDEWDDLHAERHVRLIDAMIKDGMRRAGVVFGYLRENCPLVLSAVRIDLIGSISKTAGATADPDSQPDIAYTPDYDKYVARARRHEQSGRLDASLPPGFPQKLESDLVWNGRDLARLDRPMSYLNADTFLLPSLHDTPRDISREPHSCHGFKVVQGIPVDDYTKEDQVIICAGLASHFAPVRGRQDNIWNGKHADVALAHIIDISRNFGLNNVGSHAYTTEKQVFHTDTGDVITLFCLSERPRKWSKATLPVVEPWEVDGYVKSTAFSFLMANSSSFGRGGQKSTFRPLLYHQPATDNDPERMIFQYARRYFTGYSGLPRSSDIGPITEAQAEALDALRFLAEKHAVSLDFHKGDIQFANNLSLFHARGGLRDSPEKQRHLIRFWLRDPELAWKTPEPLRPLWDKVYKDLNVDNTVFPLDPVMRDFDGVRGKKEQ
ncbi:hypothetical protein FSARC_11326 [Fusarium sarcochroum]|uniref:TauD/TfdA-like domain-containing protein n=1 Tax=Fusarium sarcochroum TaxID=1208366 RepID=A0A8H4TG80_9HYPO|nr:hypothetical protein FSARC_11326 [Fusarium sarcochroum]